MSDIKALWIEYDTKCAIEADRKREYEVAGKETSDIVKRMLMANDGVKLVNRDGKDFTIIVRDSTHFLRRGKAGRPKKVIA